MYRKNKRKAADPSAAGVKAVSRAIASRVYNQAKGQAIANSIAAASGLSMSDGVAFNPMAYQQSKARQQAGYTGVGAYKGRGGFWSDIGDKIGDTFGPGFGDMGKAGRNIGSVADALMGKFGGSGMYTGHGLYTGHGAYEGPTSAGDNVNSLIDGGGANAPLFGGDMASIVVTHREYLTDIYGPPAGNSFNVQTYNLNPALGQTFPFLSQIAANYDEYEFIQMIFTYKSTTTDIGNSTTGQCGTVIQAVNYNASAAPFPDKGIMMEYFGAVSNKVTESARCGVECDPLQNAGPRILYTRSNPVVTGQDLKTYDLGIYQLAVANSPAAYANLPIGELWVDYKVSLRKPKLFVTRGLEIDRDSFLSSGYAPLSNTLTPAKWFGPTLSTAFLLSQQNNIGCLVQPGYGYSYAVGPVQTGVDSSGVAILIPSAFNGNLRITVVISGTGFSGVITYSYGGNVVNVLDQFQTRTITGPPIVGPAVFATENIQNITATSVSFVWDVYVKQASAINVTGGVYSGGQNLLNIGGVTGTTVTSSTISIEQYQPLGGLSGMTNGLNRVAWVNSSNNQVIPTIN